MLSTSVSILLLIEFIFVGMKPSKVGAVEEDLPKETKEKTVMIHQEFIIEAETPVFEILAD